ncbi:MAG: PKD domain-containing protein [Thermoplasmata archaeon]
MKRTPELRRLSLSRPTFVTSLVALFLLTTLTAGLAGAAAPGPVGSAGVLPAATCPIFVNMTGGSLTIVTNTTWGAAPLAVQFCVYSPTNYTSVLWNFTGGSTSTSSVVAHTFSAVGAYNVTLTAYYPGGLSNSTSVWVYATGAVQKIGVNATNNSSGGPALLAVNLTTTLTGCRGVCNLDIYSADGYVQVLARSQTGPDTYWDDLSLDSGGLWVITVNATDPLGDYGTSTVMVNVTGTGPSNGTGMTVTLTAYPSSGAAPLPVNFSAAVTGGVAPYNFTFAFGDSSVGGFGGSGSLASISHQYNYAGTYRANVTAYDSAGHTASSSTTVTVTGSANNSSGSSPPSLTFNVSMTHANAPFNSTFTVAAVGGVPPYTLQVCPGDGACAAPLTNWSGAAVSYPFTYTIPGNYTASATVTDSAIPTDIVTTALPIWVTRGGPLNVSVLQSLSYGPPPLAVGFLATVTGGNAPYSIQWAWGDGTFGSSVNGGIVAHAYGAVGVYHPTLTVTDASDYSQTVSLKSVNVTANTSLAKIPGGGLFPNGGDQMTMLSYLGVAAVAAVLSGVAVAGLLRQLARRQEASRLVRDLETDGSHGGSPPSSGPPSV